MESLATGSGIALPNWHQGKAFCRPHPGPQAGYSFLSFYLLGSSLAFPTAPLLSQARHFLASHTDTRISFLTSLYLLLPHLPLLSHNQASLQSVSAEVTLPLGGKGPKGVELTGSKKT